MVMIFTAQNDIPMLWQRAHCITQLNCFVVTVTLFDFVLCCFMHCTYQHQRHNRTHAVVSKCKARCRLQSTSVKPFRMVCLLPTYQWKIQCCKTGTVEVHKRRQLVCTDHLKTYFLVALPGSWHVIVTTTKYSGTLRGMHWLLLSSSCSSWLFFFFLPLFILFYRIIFLKDWKCANSAFSVIWKCFMPSSRTLQFMLIRMYHVW